MHAAIVYEVVVYLYRKINQLNIHRINTNANANYERSLSNVLAETKGKYIDLVYPLLFL